MPDSAGPSRRAVTTGNPRIATAAAAELPRLSLADALSLLLYPDGDRRRFERAWCAGTVCSASRCGRYRPPTPNWRLPRSTRSATANGMAAATALRELLSALGQRDAALALERWVDAGRH